MCAPIYPREITGFLLGRMHREVLQMSNNNLQFISTDKKTIHVAFPLHLYVFPFLSKVHPPKETKKAWLKFMSHPRGRYHCRLHNIHRRVGFACPGYALK